MWGWASTGCPLVCLHACKLAPPASNPSILFGLQGTVLLSLSSVVAFCLTVLRFRSPELRFPMLFATLVFALSGEPFSLCRAAELACLPAHPTSQLCISACLPTAWCDNHAAPALQCAVATALPGGSSGRCLCVHVGGVSGVHWGPQACMLPSFAVHRRLLCGGRCTAAYIAGLCTRMPAGACTLGLQVW